MVTNLTSLVVRSGHDVVVAVSPSLEPKETRSSHGHTMAQWDNGMADGSEACFFLHTSGLVARPNFEGPHFSLFWMLGRGSVASQRRR